MFINRCWNGNNIDIALTNILTLEMNGAADKSSSFEHSWYDRHLLLVRLLVCH